VVKRNEWPIDAKINNESLLLKNNFNLEILLHCKSKRPVFNSMKYSTIVFLWNIEEKPLGFRVISERIKTK